MSWIQWLDEAARATRELGLTGEGKVFRGGNGHWVKDSQLIWEFIPI